MQGMAMSAMQAIGLVAVGAAAVGAGMGLRHGVAIGVMSAGASALVGLYLTATLGL